MVHMRGWCMVKVPLWKRINLSLIGVSLKKIKWRGGKVVIKSFNIVNLGKIKKVELLGYDKHIKFVQTDEALEIVLPSENPNINISVVKVEI